MSPLASPQTCKICGSASHPFGNATLLHKYDVEYFQCSNCGFVQTEPPYWLAEAYSEAIARSDVGYVMRNQRLSTTASNVIAYGFDPSGTFLDYGAGYGLFVRLMRDLGYDFRWYDKYCENIFAKGLEATEGDRTQYELITAFEVLEHLENPLQEVQEMLRFSRNLLFSTELVPIHNPRPGEWGYYAPQEGQHISLYTRRSLEILAETLGLNFYTDGGMVHLLTEKPLSERAFLHWCSARSENRRGSLLYADYASAAGFSTALEEMVHPSTPDSDAPMLPSPNFKIVLDGVFFQLARTGIARVWQSLLIEWVKTGFARHIVVLDRNNTAPKIYGVRYCLVPPFDYDSALEDRLLVQRICDEESADLFVSTYYTTPLTTPSVFMAYDMIPEVMGADLSNPMWREKHHGIREASAYLSISECTKQDLVRFFPDVLPERVTVAYCGVDPLFSPANLDEVSEFKAKYGIEKPYFLFVGARVGYKNGVLFFKAIAQLENKQDFAVVCVSRSAELEPELQPYAQGLTIHALELDDAELRLAYAGALALVYPSKYEGFGLPVLEAMSCGCPVITCPNSSIPEVGGDAVLYVEDDDVDGMAAAIAQVQHPAVRKQMIQAGLNRSVRFSWPEMAKTVSQALIRAAKMPQPPSAETQLMIEVMRWSAEYRRAIADLSVHARVYLESVSGLSKARQQLVTQLLSQPAEQLAMAYFGSFGQSYRHLLNSGLQAEPLTESEQVILAQAHQSFQRQDSGTLGALMALMLYVYPHKLPYQIDLSVLPSWLCADYLQFMMSSPAVFRDIGEADSYADFLLGWTNYLHQHVRENWEEPLWWQAAQIYGDRLNCTPLYASTRSLTQFYAQRADLLEALLLPLGQPLDWTPVTAVHSEPELFQSPASEKGKRPRLRLGILVEHLLPYPATLAVLPILQYLDRERFEVVLISVYPFGEGSADDWQQYADESILLPAAMLDAVSTIRATGLDMLLIAGDIATTTSRLTQLSAYRLARVQIVGMSTPVSPGMRSLDYRLGSDRTPPGLDVQRHFREQWIPLPGTGQCFDMTAAQFTELAEPVEPTTRQSFNLTEETVVFACSAGPLGITPELASAWAAILSQLPDSRLLCFVNLDEVAQQPTRALMQILQDRLAAIGVAGDRLIMLTTSGNSVYRLHLAALADVYLDSFPMSGLSSLLDPLMAGVLPLVIEQDTPLSLGRGAAFLRELALPELITTTAEEYVERAIALGTDAQLRKNLGDRLRAAMQQTPSFLDSKRYGQQLSRVLWDLYHSHQQRQLEESLRLRDRNLIALPDWQQPEDVLFAELADLLRAVITAPDGKETTLLVDMGDLDAQEADFALSSVTLHLMEEEELEVGDDAPEITLLPPLSADQWNLLRPRLTARIDLPHNNTGAIARAGLHTLPTQSIG